MVLVNTMNVRNFKDELSVTEDNVMVIPPETKTCSNCLLTLSFEMGFYDDKRSKDGKRGECIPCRDKDTKANEKRRASEPMCARAEAMKELFRMRFKVIKAARLSMDTGGLVIQKKIDRVLKKHGLYGDIRSNQRSAKL